MIGKLYKIAEGLNNRFKDGDDPFYIVTRLAEECGEVASQVSHFEDKGVKTLKLARLTPRERVAGRDARSWRLRAERVAGRDASRGAARRSASCDLSQGCELSSTVDAGH